MKTLIFTLICSCFALGTAVAEELKRPDSANYQKGVEALNEGNAEKAYEYLNEELTLHPDNGYAHCYMALLCNFAGEAKLAFQAVSRSLELIPEADSEYRSFAYYTRGTLFKNYQQWELAEADYTEAIRLNPKDAENYTCRAEVLLQLQKYDEALNDLTAALELDRQADVADMMLQLMTVATDSQMIDRINAAFTKLNN